MSKDTFTRSVPAGRDACNRLYLLKEHSEGEINSAGKKRFSQKIFGVVNTQRQGTRSFSKRNFGVLSRRGKNFPQPRSGLRANPG